MVLPRFELLDSSPSGNLVVSFDSEEWIDADLAIRSLSRRLGPILDTYRGSPQDSRTLFAIRANVLRFLKAMKASGWIFWDPLRAKWDLEENPIYSRP